MYACIKYLEFKKIMQYEIVFYYYYYYLLLLR